MTRPLRSYSRLFGNPRSLYHAWTFADRQAAAGAMEAAERRTAAEHRKYVSDRHAPRGNPQELRGITYIHPSDHAKYEEIVTR